MSTHVKRFLSALLVCAVGIWSAGCASTKPGEVVDTVKQRKEGDIEQSYSLVFNSTPIKNEIYISIQKKNKFEVKVRKKKEKLKKKEKYQQRPILSFISISSIPVSLYVGTKTDTKNGHLWVLGIGVVSLLLVGVMAEEPRWEHYGEYTYESVDKRVEKGSSIPLSNEPVTLRLRGKKKKYTTNSEGKARINMAEDFGLSSVEELSPLDVRATLPKRRHTESVSLNPKKWMVPYARIQENTRMRKQDLANAEVLRTIERGEELRITNEESDWLQVRRGGETGWIPTSSAEKFWAAPTRLDPSRPPSVAASVEFAEPSGNDRLDAHETATVRVAARNEGEGPAHRVRAVVEPKSHPHLSYPQSIDFGRIGAEQSKTKSIQIEADREVPSEEVALTFQFQEANGFAPSPVKLQFGTRKFIPPELTVADVGIDDASGNGIIEPGEVVDVTARIRNKSRGAAESVNAQVNFEGENVFAGPNTQQSFDLGDLGPGEHQDIQFSLLTSQQAESVPVTLDLTEKYGEFGKTGVKLPLQFNTPADQITEVQVEGQETEVDVRAGDRLSVDIEKNIPSTPMDRPDAIAVVVGVQSYAEEGAPDVEYARRDARYMREYLTQTLGFQEENILPRNPDGRLTFAEMRTLIQQKLPNYVKEGTSEVFVYYSGHGAPSTGEDKRAYLVPSDTDPNFVSDANAYRLSQFYEDLTALDAKSVTVALDACFTGQAGSGEMMLRQASPLALSVENPLLGIENATGFLASGPKQVANWYPQKKHGMFTYFFLKGLKGDADLNSDRQVTVREMQRYLTDEDNGVPHWSGRVHQRTQTPQVVSQNPGRVLVRYGPREPQN